MTKSKKILIVEDEGLLLEILETKFKKECFEVITARDGQAGLELALSQHPDLILLDIIMPKMDGMTMLKHLRADSVGKNIGSGLPSRLATASRHQYI